MAPWTRSESSEPVSGSLRSAPLESLQRRFGLGALRGARFGERLCERIEAACAERDQRTAPLEAGIEAALACFSAEPAAAVLLSTQPPREGVAVAAARRRLIGRLAAMLHAGRDPRSEAVRPPGLDERMIDATLSFVGARVLAGEAERLAELGPELSAILSGAQRAA